MTYPILRKADRKRTNARLDFLTTRLASNSRQLKKTTAAKFPTDYQRLQQQVALDMADLTQLLKAKKRQLPSLTSQSAWELIEEAKSLLPTQKAVERPKTLPLPKELSDLSLQDLQVHFPEIWPILANIYQDDEEIRQKLAAKTLPNKQELLAIHEANMGRYQDILEGYIKLKTSPKDYYQAEERIEKSRQALNLFDLQLDETLRQINEGDMMAFEISLRMIESQKSESF